MFVIDSRDALSTLTIFGETRRSALAFGLDGPWIRQHRTSRSTTSDLISLEEHALSVQRISLPPLHRP